MTIMSDKLKETLGIIEKSGNTIKEVPFDEERFEATPDELSVALPPRELVPFTPRDVPTTIPESENSDLRDDYITSRNITHTLIDMTGNALEGALNVAVETQHPKAYSVFNELASTMRLLAKDLIEMQEIYKNITKEKEAKAKIIHATQNNTYIQTTNASLSDVLDAIEDKDSGDIIDVE